MLDSLSARLTAIFDRLGGHGRLSEDNIQDALREVRVALLEADVNFKVVRGFIDRVKVKAGAALNPATTPATIEWVKDELDLVLVMSVNPGFGGQKFIPAVYPKIRQIRTMLGARGIDVSIDGGVKIEHARPLAEHGASILVAGSAVFEAQDPAKAIRELRAAAELGQ